MKKKSKPKRVTKKSKKKSKGKGVKEKKEEKVIKTSIQIGSDTRDQLYRLKFRKSYDMFLKELCELYEREHEE